MQSLRNTAIGAITFVCCLLILQNYIGILEFERRLILSGEIWRIWTGHIVHTNHLHLILNILAAVIIYFAFFIKINVTELLISSFFLAALISITLILIYPSIIWYNGLSGLLHSLVAYFCTKLAISKNKIFWIGLMLIWAKISYELTRNHYGHESFIGDMTVISEAHLLGTFFGTVTAFLHITLWKGKKTE